ncbi:TPA: hypothetical protein ACGF2C_003570 [Vibrio cholerae]
MTDVFDETSLWVVLTSIIAVLLPLIKLVHHTLHSNKSHKVQSLDVLFRVAGEKNNITNKFIMEQIFANQFRMDVDYETIEALLSCQSPSEAINLYRNSVRYLELKNGEFKFKNKYQFRTRRRIEYYIRPIVNHLLYWVFGMASGFSGLYLYHCFSIDTFFDVKYFLFNGVYWMIASIFSFCTAIIAIRFLIDKASVKKAEKLIHITKMNKINKKWYY